MSSKKPRHEARKIVAEMPLIICLNVAIFPLFRPPVIPLLARCYAPLFSSEK
jgi:hypothetical protein